MENILGTILLWTFAIIGVVASLLWVYAWLVLPPQEIKKVKKKQKKKTKNN